MTRFDEILTEVPENDRDWVRLEANRTLNTSPGYRPSDAAREVVRAYRAGRITRVTFLEQRLRDAQMSTLITAPRRIAEAEAALQAAQAEAIGQLR